MCLESSNVLLVNFMLSTGSSLWDRLFCWSIVSLKAASSTCLGTNMSSSVGISLLGGSTVTVLNLPHSISRISQSVLLLYSKSNTLLTMFLSLLTPNLVPLGPPLLLLVFLLRGMKYLDQQPPWGLAQQFGLNRHAVRLTVLACDYKFEWWCK